MNNRGNKNSIEALPKWSDTGPLGVADCKIPSLIKLESTMRALRSFNPVIRSASPRGISPWISTLSLRERAGVRVIECRFISTWLYISQAPALVVIHKCHKARLPAWTAEIQATGTYKNYHPWHWIPASRRVWRLFEYLCITMRAGAWERVQRHFTTKTRRTRRFCFGFSSSTSCLRSKLISLSWCVWGTKRFRPTWLQIKASNYLIPLPRCPA